MLLVFTLKTNFLPGSSGERNKDSATDDLTIAIASVGSIIALLCVGVFVLFLCKRKNNKREEVIAQGDENPVYGMYYFANGEHIDYGSAEVEDDNAYYGT